ncbi:MAG: alpha/beta fold hydrolase [Gemmatimonas sp.]
MSSFTVRDQFVEVPGGQVFVREWIPANADEASTPLVLLHDSLGSVDLWKEFPEQLVATLNRRIIAYDRLGFGRSTPRSALPSIQFVQEEADTYFPAIADALALHRFSLFGHSVGGAMALLIAAVEHQRCERVITEAAQAFVEDRTAQGIREAVVLFEDPEQFGKLSKRHGERARWVLDAWTKVWLSPEFADWSLDAHLRDVQCPTLAIHGDRDEYGSVAFPSRIVNGVSGPAQLAILPDCGHVPHREFPQQVLSLVSTFLSTPINAM